MYKEIFSGCGAGMRQMFPLLQHWDNDTFWGLKVPSLLFTINEEKQGNSPDTVTPLWQGGANMERTFSPMIRQFSTIDGLQQAYTLVYSLDPEGDRGRSEERRVGKEGRCRWLSQR